MTNAAPILPLVISCAMLASCGTGVSNRATIPPEGGNELAPIELGMSAGELARRAAAERERGRLQRAERFARWALSLSPSHPGALAIAARLARDTDDLERARRFYALAAQVDSGAAAELALERGAAMHAYARAELEANRVEMAAALLQELEQTTPRFVSVERKSVAALHGELADIWLGRGLAGPGREHADRAAQLGADSERTRVRLIQAEVIEAGSKEGERDKSGLGAFEARLATELGSDHERWVWVAGWANRSRRFDAAEWAARGAIALDGDEGSGWSALCDALLGSEQQQAALAACLRAAQVLAPEEGATMLVERAERFDSVWDTITLAKAAAERAPSTDAGIRAATLAAFRELSLPDGAGDASPRDSAIATLEVAVRAVPGRWLQIIAPAQAKGDVRAVARVLKVAREAGLVSWVAHAFEVEQWRKIRAGAASAPLRAEADLGAEAAFDAAIRAKPGIVGQLELARLARGDPDLSAKVEALAKRTSQPATLALLAAREQRRDRAAARQALNQGLDGVGAFESALTRAHFELELGIRTEALAQAEAAVLAAPPGQRAAAEGFAAELAMQISTSSGLAWAPVWLAFSEDGETVADPNRVAILLRLMRSSRSDRELSELIHAALLDDERSRWVVDLAQLHSQEITLLQKLGRWDEVERRWNARLDSMPESRVATEEIVAWAGQRHAGMMLRFAARLHPAEIERPELLVDLVKHLIARAEPIRARRVAERILDLPTAGGISGARLLSLAQLLLDASGSVAGEVGYLDLAARAFDRLASMGDRSSKVFAGWLTALLRLGDTTGAKPVAQAWLDARNRRDARPIEDVVKVLLEAGRLSDAISLYEQRLDKITRVESSSFNALADLYARVGRTTALAPLAERFIAGDSRMKPRLTVATATRFIEVGARAEAHTVLEAGLARHPRNRAMLALAMTMALADGSDSDVVGSALKLLRETGGSFDAWERVVESVRASGRPGAAEELVARGLERFPGAHRLLALRGTVRLLAGRSEPAFADLAEALARAQVPKDVLDTIEPILERMSLFEPLADLEARAMALAPGRADTMLTLGRALAAAGRVEESAQIFDRVATGTDRAHGIVAQAWLSTGHLDRAVDAWTKLEPTLTEDAVSMLDGAATALALTGRGERLDAFVRLYLQALRGADSPPLKLIGDAYLRVGRPDDALRWLERADRETPSVDTVLALMRLRLAMGDQAGALAAADRAVTRRVALASSGRRGQVALPAALDALAGELTKLGHPRLARELADRIAAVHGESTGTRLVKARAALAEGDVPTATNALQGSFGPWRQKRDLIGILRGVLEELVARGYLETAMDTATRALEAGNDERELLLAALRIAIRAGHSDRVEELAGRLIAAQPALNGWLTGDVFASERLAEPARLLSRRAIGRGIGDAALKETALGLTLLEGGDSDALERVLAGIPRISEDRVERARVAGFVATALSDELAPKRALRMLVPVLQRATVDPVLARRAALMASFVGDREVGELVRTLRRAHADEAKTQLELARHLVSARRLHSALLIFDQLHASQGGDGELALEAFRVALEAGDQRRARRWLDSALGSDLANAPPTLRLIFAGAAARWGSLDIAEELLPDDGGGSWRARLVRARLAVARGDVAAFQDTVEEAVRHAPNAVVARVELAELALSSVSERARWKREALALLEPVLGRGRAPAAALELAASAADDPSAAREYLSRLRARYPGSVERPALLLHGAIASRDRAWIEAVVALIPVGLRSQLLLDELLARLAGGGTGLPDAVARAVEREIARARPDDPTAVRLEVALARLASNQRGALEAAEAALARVPWSSALAVTAAEALVDNGADLQRAERLIKEVMARPPELDLFAAERRFLMPMWSSRAWEVLGRIRARRGEPGALHAFERALATAPDHAGERARLELLWVTSGGLEEERPRALGVLAACEAEAPPAWSTVCNSLVERLSRARRK